MLSDNQRMLKLAKELGLIKEPQGGKDDGTKKIVLTLT
jgi:hypothetical protein